MILTDSIETLPQLSCHLSGYLLETRSYNSCYGATANQDFGAKNESCGQFYLTRYHSQLALAPSWLRPRILHASTGFLFRDWTSVTIIRKPYHPLVIDPDYGNLKTFLNKNAV